MPQFGADPKLAEQCPQVPTPGGWRPWTDADGPVPDALAKRAQAIATDQSIPLGTTESYPLPGVTTLIRVEPRVWWRDDKGNLIQGCFRVGGVYLPVAAPEATAVTPPAASNWDWGKAVTILTAASLAVGTVATVATLRGEKRS